MRLLLTAALLLGSLAVAEYAAAEEPLRIYGSPLAPEVSPYAHLNLTPNQLLAALELEAAQYRLMTWVYYEFPAKLRNVDAEIAVAQEQLASLGRRSTEFNHFNVWSGGGNPLSQSAEDARAATVSVQQRLNLLQAERGQLLQYQNVAYRQKQMEVERARMQLRMAK